MKYSQVKQDIINIKAIHQRAIGEGKKISFLEKGKVKKQFDESHNAFRKYVEYCKTKKLELTEEEKSLLTVIQETEDLLDPSRALEREMERANAEYQGVYREVNTSGEWLLKAREESSETISQIEDLVNSIAKHPKEFDKDIKEIEINKTDFKNALEFGEQQKKALKISAEGAGAGVAAGAAVAGLAPSAAMWVATTFGTASTGTAISALSGAAAHNAALAWLGGGALATSGGGMAAGQAFLALAGPVGWTVAGGSVLVSALLLWRRRMKIEESKKQEIVRIKNCTASLKKLKADMDSLAIQTEGLNSKLVGRIDECGYMRGADYRTFGDDEKKLLGSIIANTKTLSELISKVLVNEDNNDHVKAKEKDRKEQPGTGGRILDKLFKSNQAK